MIRASFALALLALLWPAASLATVTCRGIYSSGVLVVSSDESEAIVMSVAGADNTIHANDVTCFLSTRGGPIGVDATTENTVAIQVAGGAAELDQRLRIQGIFAPGREPEEGIAEIEFEVDLGPGLDTITVSAGGGRGVLFLTFAFGARGAALNDDGDRDVTLKGVEEAASLGGPEADLLTAAGGFGTGAAYARDFSASGGSGDDRVTGGRGDDQLSGGDGDDRLIGGLGIDDLFGEDGSDRLLGRRGADLLLGGRGTDFLEGERGKDEMRAGLGRDILSARDGVRELVHGDPGRDRAKVDRGLDRVRAVEVLIDRLPLLG